MKNITLHAHHESNSPVEVEDYRERKEDIRENKANWEQPKCGWTPKNNNILHYKL